MSEYYAKISWARDSSEDYIDNKYSRGHEWTFDGGVTIQASASPHIVPLPYSIEVNVDPEEAFVASLSSGHMLFALSILAKKKFIVDSYENNAVGILEKNECDTLSMSKVTLRPKIEFSGDNKPTMEQLKKIHHQSHEQCFIANSVKTEVIVEIKN